MERYFLAQTQYWRAFAATFLCMEKMGKEKEKRQKSVEYKEN
jgi:hypothetical protein